MSGYVHDVIFGKEAKTSFENSHKTLSIGVHICYSAHEIYPYSYLSKLNVIGCVQGWLHNFRNSFKKLIFWNDIQNRRVNCDPKY